MQIGIVGLGRMGGNMARRLARSGVEVIGFDEDAKALVALAGEGVVEPAPVMSLALMMRFARQGKSDYADRLLAMMRKGFGGHAVEAKAPQP